MFDVSATICPKALTDIDASGDNDTAVEHSHRCSPLLPDTDRRALHRFQLRVLGMRRWSMNRVVDTFVIDSAVYSSNNQNMRGLGAAKGESKPRPEGGREESVGVYGRGCTFKPKYFPLAGLLS